MLNELLELDPAATVGDFIEYKKVIMEAIPVVKAFRSEKSLRVPFDLVKLKRTSSW